ncbi:DUF4404 family protein [Oceanobacter mangrovi]|uniref:DUF4404 family protein n=1 Tax=Oceanobacter mangrovi TaxID=2862510 RepID=UPI001C8E06E4|nr:DUF4404 family protein [Oceanobacter mangrovi]
MSEVLKEQLQQLHQELTNNPDLDAESAALLRQIVEDIEVIELTDNQDISEGMQRMAVEFEQDHPTLSAILRQIVDTLGRIGV